MTSPIRSHYLSVQIGHIILNSSRLSYGLPKKATLCSKISGVFVPRSLAREYTVPSAPGSGAGKGGGAGGSVRESGGALGQYGAAHEEEFFYHKQREQLEKLKSKLKKEEPRSPKNSQK